MPDWPKLRHHLACHLDGWTDERAEEHWNGLDEVERSWWAAIGRSK